MTRPIAALAFFAAILYALGTYHNITIAKESIQIATIHEERKIIEQKYSFLKKWADDHASNK